MRRSPINYADTEQVRRRRLPAKWLAAVLSTAAVALLAPGVTYLTTGPSSTTMPSWPALSSCTGAPAEYRASTVLLCTSAS